MAGTDHWNAKLSTNIQFKKNNLSVFLMFRNSPRVSTKKTRFLAYFGYEKAKYKSFMWLFTLHCFFLTLITVFFISLVPYIPICLYYFLIVCFYCHLFSPSLFSPWDTFYNLQCLLEPAHNIRKIRNNS